jgi:hypothetical protein
MAEETISTLGRINRAVTTRPHAADPDFADVVAWLR